MTDLTEQWVNIYKSKKLGGYWSGAFCYKTKKEAVKNLADKEHYFTTVNIEDMLKLQAENDKLKKYERIVTSYNIKPIDYEIACETVNNLLDEKKTLKEQNTKLKEELKDYEYQHKQDGICYDDIFCKLELARKENRQLKTFLKKAINLVMESNWENHAHYKDSIQLRDETNNLLNDSPSPTDLKQG